MQIFISLKLSGHKLYHCLLGVLGRAIDPAARSILGIWFCWSFIIGPRGTERGCGQHRISLLFIAKARQYRGREGNTEENNNGYVVFK
jgi:hypothetical protein